MSKGLGEGRERGREGLGSKNTLSHCQSCGELAGILARRSTKVIIPPGGYFKSGVKLLQGRAIRSSVLKV